MITQPILSLLLHICPSPRWLRYFASSYCIQQTNYHTFHPLSLSLPIMLRYQSPNPHRTWTLSSQCSRPSCTYITSTQDPHLASIAKNTLTLDFLSLPFEIVSWMFSFCYYTHLNLFVSFAMRFSSPDVVYFFLLQGSLHCHGCTHHYYRLVNSSLSIMYVHINAHRRSTYKIVIRKDYADVLCEQHFPAFSIGDQDHKASLNFVMP